MQRALANTMTLSCSCLLKRREARAWAMTMTTHQNSLQTYVFCTLCKPRKCGFVLIQLFAANAKGVCQMPSKTNRRLSSLQLLAEAEKRAPTEPLYEACAMTMKQQKAPQTNDFYMLCTTHSSSNDCNFGTILCHSLCRTTKHDTFILRFSLNV